jgi:cell wall-associated NlpC family hydrolase
LNQPVSIDRPFFIAIIAASIALGACASERNADQDPAAPSPSAAMPIRSQNGGAGLDLSSTPTIQVVPATDDLMRRAAAGGTTIRKILSAAKPSIGTPYKWGGTDLASGIDCSNYTWLLYRSIGVPYDRYIRTQILATMRSDAAFSQTSFDNALPGDLLVYGYRDGAGAWHGHVVILVDKSGHDTGHKGLVLGAQGTPVSAVQYVTFDGFEQGYFKTPDMRLLNVLRPNVLTDVH